VKTTVKAKILEARYEAKLEFLGGRWDAKQKTFCGRGGVGAWIFLELYNALSQEKSPLSHTGHCSHANPALIFSKSDHCH